MSRDSATDLAPYARPEERDHRLREAAGRVGGEVLPYGYSVEGRPLLAAHLPRLGEQGGGAEDDGGNVAPAVLVAAGIHGPELVGPAIALALLERVESDPVWARQGRGRMAELRPNARGVDLNRNFPLPGRRRALPGAGSLQPGSATYVGSGPLSEPESAAVAALAERCRFRASTNLHCFMGRLIPAHVEGAADFAVYRALCRAFARAQPRTRYGRLHGRRLDTFTGEMEDFQHHQLGTWAVCVETFPWWASLRQHLSAPSLFWRMNPRDPRPWIDNDLPGIAAFLHAALDRGPPAERRPSLYSPPPP